LSNVKTHIDLQFVLSKGLLEVRSEFVSGRVLSFYPNSHLCSSCDYYLQIIIGKKSGVATLSHTQ